ncbi:MAG: glycosyltransferase family 2 protein [Bacteroidales bacterium]|jgi:GT2 family glycosyltransferase|nr:glycosyltransferase family 2 protein [Bacteroidales bacterium]MDI9591889.1 glycosyltransferase family 2 protein [Bacteroidota bacterium]HOF81833.1 glycosyltransferase family 2 protein [Bacteroidales bacterium]
MMPVKQDLVVCILINYNHSKDTLDCVESLLNSSYDNFKIYLVDNGSETDDYRILENSLSNNDNINLLRIGKNIGYVGGVNYGLLKASEAIPRYFVIMNNDTIVDKDAINELVITAQKYGDNVIVTGKVYNMDEPETLQYVGQWCRNKKKLDFPPYVKNGRELDTGQYDKEIELDMTDDMFWLLPRQVFERVGYYSTNFFLYGEQNDYVLRAKKEGVKLIYTPKSRIWHHHHLTTGGSSQKILAIRYWSAYAVLMLYYLHYPKRRLFTHYFKLVIRSLAKTIFGKISKREFKPVKPELYACWYFMLWLFNKRPNDGFNPFLVK